MDYKEVMDELEGMASHDPKDLAGMARYGINVEHAWVVSVPKLRNLAKEIKLSYRHSELDSEYIKNKEMDPRVPTAHQLGRAGKHEDDKSEDRHELALKLWDTEVHEARILAGFIDDPVKVTEEQLERWVLGFDSWDVCDLVCSELFDKTEFAYQKAEEWSTRPEEFVKRAGFVVMCALAVHDKKASDESFEKFLKICERESTDERNFVKKAVNWTIRNIGKCRNIELHQKALKTAYRIREKGDKTSRWIANDAIRELESEKIKKRFAV